MLNNIGIPYILITRAPGFFISSKFMWDPYLKGIKRPRQPLPYLLRAAKEKIIRQLRILTSKILNLPFKKISSLYKQEGKFYIGECLLCALTWSSRDSFSNIARGLFSNNKDYYESILLALCYYARKLPLKHYLFLALVPKVKDF